MSQQGEITGFTNVFWGGVTTLELAKAIEYFIDNNSNSGIIHLTNGEKISKLNLLLLFKSIWNINNLSVKEGSGTKSIDKSLAKTDSVNYYVPPYGVMLEELYDWMNNYRTLYYGYKY
jgi:dTDP-4-dehydrorhamnose reductase